jgi:hypothetical protein
VGAVEGVAEFGIGCVGRREAEIVGDGRRQEARVLRDEGHVRAQVGRGLRRATDPHLTGGRGLQPGDDPQQRRLSRAGRPDEAHARARWDAQVDAAQRRGAAGVEHLDAAQVEVGGGGWVGLRDC